MWKMIPVFALLVLPAVAADKAETDPRDELKTAIPHAIKLLESKQYETFLKSYLSPEDRRRILAQTSLKRFAKIFAEEKADRLLKLLRAIGDQTPTLTENGTVAEYTVKEMPKEGEANETVKGKNSIRFKKIDEHWTIVN